MDPREPRMNFPSRRACIAGIGSFGPGDFVGVDATEMYTRAALATLSDAGVRPDEIDGFISVGAQADDDARDVHRHHIRMMELLGLSRLTYADTCKLGAGAVAESLRLAALYIDAGILERVLIVGGDALRGEGRDQMPAHGMSVHDRELELPFGPTLVSMWAMITRSYLRRYGVDERQLGHVAVNARMWAQLNPAARYRDPLSLDDYQASRLVSTPLRLLDCSVIVDGAAGILVTSADEAERRGRPPVYVTGVGSCYSRYYLADFDAIPESIQDVQESGALRAYESARLGPEDVSILYPYDGFSIMAPMHLEALGFVRRGEGLAFLEAGHCGPGGDLPMNTHGGSLNHSPPGFSGVFFYTVEAVEQLRGMAGTRQVQNAKTAMLAASSGVGGVSASWILTNW